MKNLILVRLFALLFVVASVSLVQSQAQSVYHVRAGATGANNGSDWNNAFTTLPSSLVRGATYYIADGAYGSYTFNDAASGTTPITIIKATVADHGTVVGWQDSYGDGQASFGGTLRFDTPYWTMDGVTGGGPGSWTSGFGFKINVTNQTSGPGIRTGKGANHLIFRHIEIEGNGGDGATAPANDGVHSANGQNTGLTFSYVYIHNMGRTCWKSTTHNMFVEYAYTGEFESTSDQHSEIASIYILGGSVTNVTFANSIFTWFEGTGGIMMGGENLTIYGCTFINRNPNFAGANGMIGTWSAYSLDNLTVYNNSFLNCEKVFWSPHSNWKIKNNIFYDVKVKLDGMEHDYNHFINLRAGSSIGNEPEGTSGIGNPFVNSANDNFRLLEPTSPGLTLPSPYNVSPDGTPRGSDGIWDRGAFEFGIGVPDTTPPGVSNPEVSSVSSSGAVIAWTTDEPASSTVEYGSTTAYGSTAASISLVLAHSVVLSDLTADTLYHYRVVSRDLAGNTATSGDFTFRTGMPDTTPPAIALTSPLPGAVLSNQASFQANATDNVGGSGVVEVAFYVGEDLVGEGGTADSTNYGISWDTTTVANGTYSVQAVARDAEGNEAASAAINVSVQNTPPDLTDGLLGYWALDETSGMVASDSSGNGNHGVVMKESGWTTGRLKGARLFSGAAADHYVDLGPINVTGDQLTLAAWIRPFSFGHDPRVLAKSEGINTGQMYWLLEVDDGSPHRVGFRVNAGGSELRLTGGTVEAGEWIHVVGAYDGTRMRLYLNGVQVANQAKTGSLRTGSAPAWIGNNPPDGQRPFDGVIDDVRIYNRALTSADIAELQKKTNPNAPAGIELLGN